MLIMLQYFPLKTDIEKPLKQKIIFDYIFPTYICIQFFL